MPIQFRDKARCQFDLIALGEIMLRLDPGEGRIRCAREFKVWEGGGEYNVARGLRRCFGLKTAVCTAFADNDVGHLLEDFILQGGVDTEFIKWVPFDGVGRVTRNGLNFTERGFGVRGAVGVSDRGHTAASQLKPGDFDWDHIFGKLGVRWLHTGGIFAALSDTTPPLVIEAVKKAKQTRHDRQLRSELPPLALENHRRPETRPGSQPRNRQIRGRDDRQRGGFHRLPRVSRSKARTKICCTIDVDRLQEDDRDGGEGLSELQGRRHDAARRQNRDRQRLGAPSAGWTANFTRAENIPTWKFSTVSAAATVLPPA